MTDVHKTIENLVSIYDHPTSNPSGKPASNTPPVEAKVEATADDMLAQKLYGPKSPLPKTELPESVKTLRANDSKIYDPTAAYSDITDDDLLGEAPLESHPPEMKQVIAQELRGMMNDVGLANVEAREIVTVARGLAKEPPTEETEARWVAEINKKLLDQNDQNQARADADLELARQLVRRDPRVRDILNSTRLGSHPRVVEVIVQLARAEKLAGRLK